MRRELTRQIIKLWLLALVLTLALLWYSLNPVPATAIRRKTEDEPPDEKTRHVEPLNMRVTLPAVFLPSGGGGEVLPSSKVEMDDFDWPEFIDG